MTNNNMITLNYEIDEEKLSETINEAIKLDDNEQMFNQLCEVKRAKAELEDALEALDKIEVVAKGLINSKAKELYGNDWQTIAGQGYKITRSKTGSIYQVSPMERPNKKFLIIKESIDSKAVDAAIEKSGKLPKGIEINPNRGESIRVALK